MKPLLTLELRFEHDVVSARKRARQISALLKFGAQDQTRIATAVSEVARNAFEYAGGGKVDFAVDELGGFLQITVRDEGHGIKDLDKVLAGKYVSRTGLGLGLIGARRLMDRFEIDSQRESGTRVVLAKALPKAGRDVDGSTIQQISNELMKKSAENPFEEIQAQNQEILRAMDELKTREAETARLNQELQERNRGVLALYAELDEKALSLQEISKSKTRFLSNMTHEFRTPLNSILSLSKIALAETDAKLDPEHKQQLVLIQKSGENLSELVNELLDIAKIEAGRVDVRPRNFKIDDLFGSLRGMLKPLLPEASQVSLIFDETGTLPPLHTDETKLAQILRNLISNALKYTESGSVRVTASVEAGQAVFQVTDTGIGVDEKDQARIFEEFVQVDSKLQKRIKGTGLGLPLSKSLAGALGGTLTLTSTPGAGSTFVVTIPSNYTSPLLATAPAKKRLALVIDDEESSRYILRSLLTAQDCQVLEAADGYEGIRLARDKQPELIFLDLRMPSMSGFYILELLQQNPVTKQIPVIIHTSMHLSEDERTSLMKHALAILPKSSLDQAAIQKILGGA